MRDVSFIIPARNEEFLGITIESILKTAKTDFEIIAVLDGYWPDPPIEDNPRVTLIHHSQSIGQRAAINEAARMSTANYLIKCDAHCTFDEGFDAKMIAPYEAFEIEKDTTSIPRMYNLHAFNWECVNCKEVVYQGPPPVKCEKCGTLGGDRVEGAYPPRTKSFKRVMVWQPRFTRKTDFARFDHTLHFQYWGAYGKRPEAQGEIADVMCFVGACFMMPRDRFWELDGCDERHGSWGQQGVEVSCKSWLSGGRQVVNKRTWFSHLFRTQPGFGFPYPNPGIEKAREHSRRLWFDGKWEKAKHPLSWLIKKFAPIPDWDEPGNKIAPVHTEKATKGICFYTENLCPEPIFGAVKKTLLASAGTIPIVSVSLKPIDLGKNIVLNLERGYLTMFKQILAGLMALDTDIAFLCEHDVIYHPSHFDFTPRRKDTFYYNQNQWKIDAIINRRKIKEPIGRSLFFYCNQTSGLCANRKLLINHYVKRITYVEENGYKKEMGFEPGTNRFILGIDSSPAEKWESKHPNLDIRHGGNLTKSRFSQSEFRNKNTCLGWKLLNPDEKVPFWGTGEEILRMLNGPH